MKPLSLLSSVIRPGKPGLIFFPLILAGMLLGSGCGRRVYIVSSLGPSHAITVDGDANDWSGALSYVARDHLFVGFMNDRENLFICLTMKASGERPGVPMAGLMVWIDPSGGSKKMLGIRLAGPEAPQSGGPGEGRPEREAGRKPKGLPEDRELGGERPSLDRPEEIEILGPGGDVQRKLAAEAAAGQGLELKSDISSGTFVLEVRIPLHASDQHPVAVGAGPDGIVGVGFLSRRAASKDERNGPPEGGMPGGIGGGGMPGGMGGGPGGMRPNMDPDVRRALKVWTRVRLRQADQPGRSAVLGMSGR